jgi:hypothetical protein
MKEKIYEKYNFKKIDEEYHYYIPKATPNRRSPKVSPKRG